MLNPPFHLSPLSPCDSQTICNQTQQHHSPQALPRPGLYSFPPSTIPAQSPMADEISNQLNAIDTGVWEEDSDENSVDLPNDTPIADIPIMKFCQYDYSMLYPTENKADKKLVYACRICDHKEEATSGLVYSNRVKKMAKNMLATIPDSIIDDPTLSRNNVKCEMCSNTEAVFFRADEAFSTNSLSLIFVCCNCSHKWVSSAS